jgi:RTX calcium-binding nonapeptide repeat (4 copies)
MLRPYETACEKMFRGSRRVRSKRSAAVSAAAWCATSPVMIEPLEPRQMLSASLSNGTLTVGGDSGPNTILLKMAGGGASVKVMVDGDAQKFPASQVTQVDVSGGPGKDYIAIKEATGAFTIPALLNGNGGGDTIIGASGADTLISGNGKDSLQAGSGANVLEGGAGKDSIVGGSGDDLLQAGSGPSVLTGGGGYDTIVGTSADTMTTNSSQNLISDDGGNSYHLQNTSDLSNVSIPSAVADAKLDVSPTLIESGGQGSEGVFNPNILGYTPEQVRTGFDFPALSAATSTNLGQGETISIIDFGDNPTAESDLATFSQEFDLPAPTPQNFEKIYATPNGQAPAVDADFGVEIDLDIEWAHAIAPDAKIDLIEGSNTTSVFDQTVLNGQQFAQTIATAGTLETDSPTDGGVVSMSFGIPESSVQLDDQVEYTIDQLFASFPAVSFIASAGDSLEQANYPAMSPYVTSVGGISFFLNSQGQPIAGPGDTASEQAWDESGGGVSLVEPEPPFQANTLGVVADIPGTDNPARVGPDVAFLADPATGVAVYDTSADPTGNTGWQQVGGTSLASPMFAATVAMADQIRVSAGKPVIGGNLDNAIYDLATDFPNRDFTDITTPAPAAVGYDLVTGWGVPIINAFTNDLATLDLAGTTPPPEDQLVNISGISLDVSEYLDDTTADELEGLTPTVDEFSGSGGVAFSVGPESIGIEMEGSDTFAPNATPDIFFPPPPAPFVELDFNVSTGYFSGLFDVTAVPPQTPNLLSGEEQAIFFEGNITEDGSHISGDLYTANVDPDGNISYVGNSGVTYLQAFGFTGPLNGSFDN